MNSQTLPVTVSGDALCFGSGVRVTFQRTLRIPDDGRDHPLPPGLGVFPLRRIEDHASRVPAAWAARGGVILPMYQREALWICLHGQPWKPRAVKVAAGKICAITGKPWSESLHAAPQDYLVTPPQPWLDGIAAGKGMVRQFVAMPLGLGYTVEAQVSGEERFGGIQLAVFEPRPGCFPDQPPEPRQRCSAMPPAPAAARALEAGAMGLGAGGRMKQKVYPDRHGIETWDPACSGRIFVHIVNSEMWRDITGEPPPPSPVSARTYAQHGLPWFALYDEHLDTLAPGQPLTAVQSIKDIDAVKSALPLQDDAPVGPVPIQVLPLGSAVRDGDW
jgi:hypothetical protein